MKKATVLATAHLIAGAGLSACSQAPEPAPATVEVSAPAAEPAQSAPVAEEPAAPIASTVLWAEPLSTCESNQVATIQWSKEAVVGGPGRIVNCLFAPLDGSN